MIGILPGTPGCRHGSTLLRAYEPVRRLPEFFEIFRSNGVYSAVIHQKHLRMISRTKWKLQLLDVADLWKTQPPEWLSGYTCASQPLWKHLQESWRKETYLLPDLLPDLPKPSEKKEFPILHFGTFAQWNAALARNLREVLGALQYPYHCTVLCEGERKAHWNKLLQGFPVTIQEWDWQTAPMVISSWWTTLLTVGEFPAALYKSPNRAVLSVLLGTPVIAQEIPAYRNLVQTSPSPTQLAELLATSHAPGTHRTLLQEQREACRPWFPEQAIEPWKKLAQFLESCGSESRVP